MKTVFSTHSYEICVSDRVTDELKDFLKNYTLGTPGGMRYRLLNILHKLDRLRDVYFLVLKRSGSVIGCIGLLKRTHRLNGREHDWYYIRYFSIDFPMMPATGEKYRSRQARRPNLIVSLTDRYFSRPHLLAEQPAEEHDDAFNLLMGTIEEANYRSLNLGERLGLEPVRKFRNFAFTRFRPRSRSQVEIIREEDKAKVRNLLQEFYREHTLYHEENLFLNDHFFVYRQQGKIVAGLQANPVKWEIVKLPGINDFVLHSILPYVPGFRKLFRRDGFFFTGIEYVFYLPGHVRCIQSLIETALNHHRMNLAMIWMDTEDPLLNPLEAALSGGTLSSFISKVEAGVRIKFNNASAEHKEPFFNRSVFLSSYDMS